MLNTNFNQIKTHYERERDEQRTQLVLYLKERLNNEQLRVINGGTAGKGNKTYNNSHTIEEFDLTNWKWIEVKDEEGRFSCIISLNMIDIDKGTANFHALYDRIGLISSYKKGTNTYKTYIWTDIDLPLDNSSKEKVYNLVTEQYNSYNK